MDTTKTIVRYSNRKLYADGRYIGLKHIQNYIVDNTPFKVIDYSSKKDYTSETVAAALYKRAKEQTVETLIEAFKRL
jgi:polyhydroxyalkanoate synthesis regulator protein